MNRINKILWGMFSTLICAFYNVDVRAECNFSIARMYYVEADIWDTHQEFLAACSAFCADYNGGGYGVKCNTGNWANPRNPNEFEGFYTVKQVCPTGFYASSCDGIQAGNTGFFDCLRTKPISKIICPSCPSGGTTRGSSTLWTLNKGVYGANGQTTHLFMCSHCNPLDGVCDGDRIIFYHLVGSCEEDVVGVDVSVLTSCYIPAGKSLTDSVGGYKFTTSCYY